MEREERSCNVRLRKTKKQVSSTRRKRRRERKKQRHMIGEKEEKERGK